MRIKIHHYVACLFENFSKVSTRILIFLNPFNNLGIVPSAIKFINMALTVSENFLERAREINNNFQNAKSSSSP